MILAVLGLATATARPLDWSPAACEQVYPEGDDFEIFLVTMAPGDEAFSFVGHTALWARRPGHFDRIFNFGTIDSQKQEPASALMLGTLECWWTTRGKDREIARYQRRERTMVAQRIELPEDRKRRFFHALRERAKGREAPEVFHWYENNCATGVRDTLDQSLNGAVHRALTDPSPMTPRQEVLRHLSPQLLAWFGWDFISGPWADQTIDRYHDAFIPERLAEGLADVEILWPDGTRRPLMGPPCSLYQGRFGPAPRQPPEREPGAWGLGLLTAGGAVGLGRSRAKAARWALGGGIALLGLIAGLGGTISMLLGAFSALEGLGPNENWFVANPISFLLVGLGWRIAKGDTAGRWWRGVTVVLAGLALVGLLLPVLPQDNLVIMGVFVPPLLATMWLAWRP